MRSFFFTFLLLFTLLESSKAQDALKALKYFDEGDITKGIEKLEKGIEKDTGAPANYFVLAHLYSLPSFYAESVDSAHYYIQVADTSWNNLKVKLKKKYDRKGMDSLKIEQLSLKIDSLAFSLAESKNSAAAFNHFIKVYPDSRQYKDAILLRNELAYKEALSVNTPEALADFFRNYPDAPQAKKARDVFENLYYEEFTASKSKEAYEQYILQRPNTIFAEEAALNLLKLASTNINLKKLAEFTQQFSDYKAAQLASDYYNFVKSEQSGNPLLTHYEDSIYYFFDVNQQEFLDLKLKNVIPDSCKWITNGYIEVQAEDQRRLLNKKGELILDKSSNSEKLSFGWIKYPESNSYLFNIKHIINHELLNDQGLEFNMLNPFYYAKQEAKGWQLCTFTGEPLLKSYVDSIWFENDIFFLKKGEKIAITRQQSFEKNSLTDLQSLAFLYTDYAFLDDYIWLASDNFETVLNKSDLQIMLPLQFATITNKGSYWLVREEGNTTLYNKEFTKLIDDRFQQVVVKDETVALEKDNKWALVNWSKNQFPSFVYDSVRLFTDWLAYAENEKGRQLIFEDSITVQIDDESKFQLLNTYNEVVLQMDKEVRFLQVTNEKGYSRIFDGGGKQVWEGEYVELKILTPDLIYIKKKREDLLVDLNKGITKLEGVTAVGSYNEGLIPLLKEGLFGAYSVNLKQIISPESDARLQVFNKDSVYIFKESGKLGLCSNSDIIVDAQFNKILKLNDRMAFVENSNKWQLINILTQDSLSDNLQTVEVLKVKNENYFKIREDKGFGILNNKADLIVPAIFNSLTLYNHKDQLLWIAERNLEELDYKVLAYINKDGEILFKQGFSSEEFLVNSCD
ncbi:tetratricopeptide repeat protein [Marivirga atlantica]|jgi:hypothetical protein|uniref:Outer membrane lipoprotein BamD-like domain-containing protein n=1 Tax=Marivirga atlantica TaxID=1548457 RepID=A0A937ADU0_9BACT|nr:hypothetical protein [Marivirga atlantica]MBL0764699.1 hypothetical protein [Marivirga atlantica]